MDSSITRQYHLAPIFLSHYDRVATILQKIVALAERNITQVRDIFDLYLLAGNKPPEAFKDLLLKMKDKDQLKIQMAKAIKNLNGITYHDFQSQVITYLAPEYKKIYSSQEVWQQIVRNIKQILEEDYLVIR